MPCSSLRLCALAAAFLALTGLHASAQLTSAIAVRSLPHEEARKGLEVELRAKVIFIEGPKGTVFVQDETAGTFFRPSREVTLRAGDEVAVKGVTAPGLYVPGIERTSFRLIRHGDVPAGTPASHADLISGRFHYQRVAVEGIVRSITETGEEGRSRLQLAMGPDLLEVRIHAPLEKTRSLVDSRVRIEGLAAGTINNRRQLVKPSVWLQDWSDITVLEPAISEEEVPVISGANLLAFDVTGQGGHRVRVAGTVVAAFPDGAVFMRDGSTAIGLRLCSPAPLSAGDQVEVIGFPQMQRFSASMSDAILVHQTPGDPPVAAEVSIKGLIKGAYDNDFVAVTATVTDTFRAEGGHVLVLQDNGRTIRAYLPELDLAPPVGAQVRVAGICMVESSRNAGFSSLPETVSLRVRSQADVTILRSPSWWTVRRLGSAIAVLLLTVLLAGLWIAALRRQVRQQTAALRTQIEQQAALEERQRIAREFHDTLEQGLAGLCLRLEAIQARGIDDKSRNLLRSSRGLVSQIQTETRSLVSDLRDPSGGACDIAAAFAAIVERHPAGCGPELRLEIASPLPPLPSRTVHHLRMIAQEAVTNALKHAAASTIRLGLDARDNQLIMTVADDGCGFDVATQRGTKAGHFGCIGIEERCDKLGAEAHWLSAPGKGTRVEVILPLPKSLEAVNGKTLSNA